MSGLPEQKVDVVVVGGGPAGSATALWCLRHGLKVAMLEREAFPRHRPGETLPPAAEVLFAQLGISEAISRAGFSRHTGTWVTWGGPRRFDAFGADSNGTWLGFQAPRDRLDKILLDAAIDAGAIVYQPSRGLRLLTDEGRISGVATSELSLRAAWVVDAAGGQHWLARQLGIPRTSLSPRLIVRYGYLRDDGPHREGSPEILADEDGWTWTAHIAPGLYHWTRLVFGESKPGSDGPPAIFADLTPISAPRGADVTWRVVDRPAGPGYICVGDAAAVLDPASSHGVLKALMSGMMAGHVIARSLHDRVPAGTAIYGYTGWLREQFSADVTALTAMYRTLPNPPAWVREG